MSEKQPKVMPYEEWMELVTKLAASFYGNLTENKDFSDAQEIFTCLQRIHAIVEKDMRQFAGSVRKPGNWLYECGHQRMRPETGEVLPDPCEQETLEGKRHRPMLRSVTLHLMTGEVDGKQPATKPHEVKVNSYELSREFRNLIRREFGDGWRGAMSKIWKIEMQ